MPPHGVHPKQAAKELKAAKVTSPLHQHLQAEAQRQGIAPQRNQVALRAHGINRQGKAVAKDSFGRVVGGIAHAAGDMALTGLELVPGIGSAVTPAVQHFAPKEQKKVDANFTPEALTGYKQIEHIRQHPIAGTIAAASLLPFGGEVGKAVKLGVMGEEASRGARAALTAEDVTRAAEQARQTAQDTTGMFNRIAANRKVDKIRRLPVDPASAHADYARKVEEANQRAFAKKDVALLKEGDVMPETGGQVGAQIREGMKGADRTYQKQRALQRAELRTRVGKLTAEQKKATSLIELAHSRGMEGKYSTLPFEGFDFLKSPEPQLFPVGELNKGSGHYSANLEDLYKSLPNDGQHLYHSTDAASLEKITREGLKPGKVRPGEPTGVYFAEDGTGVSSLRPSRFRKADVVLRVNKGSVPTETTDIFEHGSGFNEHVSKQVVSPDKIEYLGKDGSWHPLSGSEPNPTQKAIAEHIQSLPMATLDKKKLSQAIVNGINGDVPKPFERKLIDRAFGKLASEKIAAAEPSADLAHHIVDIMNIPRAFKTAGDFSWGLRQGLVALTYKPDLWAKELGPMFKSAISEAEATKRFAAIHADPETAIGIEHGLAITDPNAAALGMHEEPYQSQVAERLHELKFVRNIWGVKHVAKAVSTGVRASDRAYVVPLNEIRLNLFKHFTQMAADNGHVLDDELLHDIADIVNTFTGRGNLGKKLAAHRATINAVFFSPGLMKSRINMLNPYHYYALEPFARAQQLKAARNLVGTIGLTLYLARAAGAKVTLDPRNSDFGKIKIGNTRVDIGGGMNQYITLGSRIATLSTVSSTSGKVTPLSGKFGGQSAYDVGMNFLDNKTSPVLSEGISLAKQSRFGQPLTPTGELGQMFAPLIAQDMWQIARAHGPGEGPGMAAATFLPDLFGVGVQNYAPPKKKSAGNPFSGGSVGGGLPSGGSVGGGLPR